MKRPDIEVNGSIYSLSWPEANLVAVIDRVTEDSKHIVSGEVTLRIGSPGMNSHLHQARINLTSTTSRNSLVKQLEKRAEHLNWEEIIEQMCVGILRAYRQGEPAVLLATIGPAEKLRYRIRPIIIEMEANLIFGPGGIGKSLLATYLSLLVERAKTENGLEASAGHVLYLDYESSPYEAAERTRAILKAWGGTVDHSLVYRRCHQSLTSDLEAIQQIIVEHKIDMVVVDSGGPACGGEPENAGVAIAFFNSLRALKRTTLTIAHVAKSVEKKGMPFGSVYWWNLPRQIFELRRGDEQNEEVLELGLWNVKANNARRLKPLGFQINMALENDALASCTVKRIEPKSSYELAKGLTITERIEAVLIEPMPTDQLAEMLEVKEESLRSILNRSKDRFIHLPQGWAKKTNQEPPF